MTRGFKQKKKSCEETHDKATALSISQTDPEKMNNSKEFWPCAAGPTLLYALVNAHMLAGVLGAMKVVNEYPRLFLQLKE